MQGVVSVSVSLNTKRLDIFWAFIVRMKCCVFTPVASIGDVEVEVPGLDVSECSPGRHVRGGHTRAALALSCHNTDDDDNGKNEDYMMIATRVIFWKMMLMLMLIRWWCGR